MSLRSVDLLEELRAVLDELEPILTGRIVDIEMSRLRAQADPVLFRREFSSLIEGAVADAKPGQPITVRVARTEKSVRIEVLTEAGGAQFEAVIGVVTLPVAPGAASPADI
jgi:light-regulated signal transduction histidine kinase (bacteriophytochrome)